MIVCLEGIDGSGKSTAAQQLATEINGLNIRFNGHGIRRENTAYATVFSISDFANQLARRGELEDALCNNYGTISPNNFKDDYEAYNAIKDKLADGSFSNPIINCAKEIQSALNRLNSGDKSPSAYDNLALQYLNLGNLITPILEHYDEYGHYIILDRWIWSTIAYNAAIPNTLFSNIIDNREPTNDIISREEKAKAALDNILKPDLVILLDINTRLATHRRTYRGGSETVLENVRYQALVKSAYESLLYFSHKALRKFLTKRFGDNVFPNNIEVVIPNEYTSEPGDTVRTVIDKFFKYYR